MAMLMRPRARRELIEVGARGWSLRPAGRFLCTSGRDASTASPIDLYDNDWPTPPSPPPSEDRPPSSYDNATPLPQVWTPATAPCRITAPPQRPTPRAPPAPVKPSCPQNCCTASNHSKRRTTGRIGSAADNLEDAVARPRRCHAAAPS